MVSDYLLEDEELSDSEAEDTKEPAIAPAKFEYGHVTLVGNMGGSFRLQCVAASVHRDEGAVVMLSVVGDGTSIKAFRAIINDPRSDVQFEISAGCFDGSGKYNKCSHGYRTEVRRLTGNWFHMLVVSKDSRFLMSGDDESLWQRLTSDKFTTPIIREWSSYIIEKLRGHSQVVLVERWKTSHKRMALDYMQNFQCHCVILHATSEVLDQIVSTGIQRGDILIPESNSSEPKLSEVTSIGGYMERYGTDIGRQAQKSLAPLHVPGRDRPYEFAGLLRKPYEAQAHAATAGVKQLNRDNTLFMIAECGTGKTIMSLAVIHEKFKNRPYRVMVFCPPQLIEKWEREIRKTIPGVNVIQLKELSQVMAVDRWDKPDCPEWWIIKENIAKDGASWGMCVDEKNDVAYCPSCGRVVTDKNGTPLPVCDLEGKQHVHEWTVIKGQTVYLPTHFKTKDDANKDKITCSQPLWTHCRDNSGNARWAIALYCRTHLRKFWDILIVDEVHEQRGADTARANAMGQMAAAAKQCIALTGTLAGGYAWQIRNLIQRLCPKTLCTENLAWENEPRFNEIYGRIETKIITTSGSESKNVRSKGSQSRQTKNVKPGIMPTLFGRHLMDKCIFLMLDELADNLPPLLEDVIPLDMDREVAKEYERIEKALSAAIRAMLQKGDRSLLGTMLRTLLTYPDHPYGFEPIVSRSNEVINGVVTVVETPVVEPKDLCPKKIREKQRALVNYVLKEKADGRQCWIYIQDTNKYDCMGRLAELLEEVGLTVKILRTGTPKTEHRERWIAENGPKCDVILSHPKLVQTGLDLFDVGGGHNFCTLIFWQTGYELYVMRQAARRAWRIGQTEICKVVYMYYKGTMQERAMTLMGRKLSASETIEGRFTAEGLAALAGDDETMEVALAKSLVNKIDDTNADRTWERITSTTYGTTRATVKKGKQMIVTDDGLIIEKITNKPNGKALRKLFDLGPK